MEPILGSITLFAFDWAPVGWARCDGTVLSISSNTALFSLLGTTYGGNGQTTFALPDLRGRAPMHDGTGPGLSPKVIGQVGGTESVTLTAANVAPHTHAVAATATASSKSPSGMVPGYTDGGSAYGASDGTTMAPAMIQPNAGGSTPVDIESPYLAMNYCIAVEGIYPSRP
jgi:microcystin-dependent protein